MPNSKNYWATKRDSGWAVQREGNDRATSLHATQQAAWNEAKERARETQGEAYLQGRDRKIRERNTYGHDPEKSKG
jgi:hypothetical protein